MNAVTNDVFGADLLKEEQVLWMGQPDPGILFTGADVFLVPFSLFWGGFALFWEASVLIRRAPMFFSLWGIPFVLLGLYFIFGRFLYKSVSKRRTYCAVTNQRVLVLNTWRHRHLQAAYITAIADIALSTRSNGTGTIRFGGSAPAIWGMYDNTGMDFFARGFGRAGALAFFDIRDAVHVYDLVNAVRNRTYDAGPARRHGETR
jgi:hypothetical protein